MAKKILFVLVGLILAVSGCSAPEEASAPAEAVQTAAPSEAVNVLTDAEKAEGWELLFDGQVIDKFRAFRGEGVPPGWQIEDGTLAFIAEHGEEGFGDIMTIEQYESFELSLDWKTAPCGNSGVLFHVTEDAEQEWHTGPEVQIVDATEGCWSDYRADDAVRHPGSDLKFSQFSGANYDLHDPSEDAVKPVGEWNTMKVIVNGPHVEHWLNGVKTVEYELWSPEWNELVAASKFNEYPKYGMNKTGHIVLQDHGKSVWFRNLKLRKL